MIKIIGFNLTEKSTELASQGKYTFWVDSRASKVQIKMAIEDQFKVEVTKVSTVTVKGKTKSFRQKIGRRADRKKAILTLKKGQKIKEFETVE